MSMMDNYPEKTLAEARRETNDLLNCSHKLDLTGTEINLGQSGLPVIMLLKPNYGSIYCGNQKNLLDFRGHQVMKY